MVGEKSKMWVLRFIFTNKYFLSALVSFVGLMWVIDNSRGIASEWHWFWVYFVAGLITLGMVGVGVLLACAMFDSWMAD